MPRLSSARSEMGAQLEDKYQRNWGLVRDIPGLSGVLERAPFACIPDDHEFWNNFPLPQIHLPSTRDEVKSQIWSANARALFGAYQEGGAREIDVDPLSFFLLDTRSAS